MLDGSLPLNGFLSPDGSLYPFGFLLNSGSLGYYGFLNFTGSLPITWNSSMLRFTFTEWDSSGHWLTLVLRFSSFFLFTCLAGVSSGL